MSSTESVTVGDVGQPDRRAVAIGHDQRPVFVGLEQLVGGADRPGVAVVGDLALGPVGVGGAQHRADVFQADAEMVQHRRIHLDAHGRQRAAPDDHLPDAVAPARAFAAGSTRPRRTSARVV